MNLIEQGIFHNLIIISEDEKQISYCNFHRPRNYNNPEEKVQAETFIKLVLQYGYNSDKIRMYETVTMGADKREADIIV